MRLALAPSAPRAPLRRGARISRSSGRKTTVVRAVLGQYQYRTRMARLRQKGVQLYEFGERVLQQGSYGDDVMQLQAYLAEQGYLNADGGLTGYFGDTTRDALISWQQHQSLSLTGVFAQESKWAVLRQQEAALRAAQTQALVAAVATAPPPLPVAFVQAQPAVATGVLGVAAIAGGLVLAGPRLMGRDGLAAKAGVQLLRGVRWTAAALLGAAVAASRVLYGAASGAVQGAARAAAPPLAPVQQRAPTPAPAAPVASVAPRRPASPAGKPRAEYSAVAPAELAARLAALEDEEDNEDAAEEAAYLAAVAATRGQQAPAKPRRLSEEEVQQRIAVMKGEVSPRAPAPQRPAPRPLPLSKPKPEGDPITGSKYGTYYGGRQVRDKVKQYLEADTSIPHGGRANTPASRRLESMGYQMSTRPRARPAKPSAAPPPAAPAAQQAPPEVAAVAAPIPLGSLSVSAQPDEPFRDVVEPIVVESAPKELLSGTELEAAPDKRGRPVPVVKPGQAVPLQLQPGSGAPQAAAAAPRPVPVVKPQKRATIGDMLRSATRSGGEDPYAEPYALVNGSGRNSGMSVGGGSSAGGYGAPLAPPPPQASYQPPAIAASSAGPAPGGAFPVNTGSSYAAAAAGGGGGQPGGGDEGAPVQYNPDGSVVLASKPIKLVKPAHLLPKTYGFEQMGVPLADKPALPEQYSEGAYYAGDYEQEQEGGSRSVFGSAYRRRPTY
ncbi:hypothetical protein ABPG75_013476 [Micractinium tetrahymenae]